MSPTSINSASALTPSISATPDLASATSLSSNLPDVPLVTIRPSKSWKSLNVGELWEHRELLYFLTWRDVKVRYKQTSLGIAWTVIQPLFTMLVFTLIFGRLAGVPSDNIPYPLFAYAGLLPWTFFSNAVTTSGNSLVTSSHLITKVYFPRLIVPSAAVGAGLLDFAISFGLLILLMIYYKVTPTWHLLMVLPMLLLTTLLALGVGIWISALTVRYRDVRFAVPFLLQLGMFISPIIYPSSLLPGRWGKVFALNPMTGIIEGYRSALFGKPFKWTALAASSLITVALLIYSAYAFRRMEKGFADIV
jgi:lipopolysaccharide transport system permease protein